MTDFATPLLWGPDQLDADIEVAIAQFRIGRFEESAELYPNFFDQVLGNIEALFEQTTDLTRLVESAKEAINDPLMLEALRYLASPPISKDDFLVLIDIKKISDLKDSDVQKRIIETIRMTLDRRRFPWVGENRMPTETEKQAALIGSAALLASQRVLTFRRNDAKQIQEDAVKQVLANHGLIQIPAPKKGIQSSVEGPKPGEFCSETLLGTRKSDITVRLWDNRFLPIECKVSNSSTNSVKRINNDVAKKAVTWAREFGERNIVPASVISGVFKRHQIVNSQAEGLMVIWAHRLSDLTDFIDRTK